MTFHSHCHHFLPKKPSRTQTRKNPDPSGSKGGAQSPVAKELVILDTMHDLLNTEPDFIYDIFKNEMDIPGNLKKSFIASSYSFTRDASTYIHRRANIHVSCASFIAKQPEINAKKLQKDYDSKLMTAISSWSNMAFVLDNFVANLKTGANGLNSQVPMSKGTFAFIGYAYLIVLIANMKRLNVLVGNKIRFIDGFFMHIDGNYVERFLILFCKTVSRLTNMYTSVRAFKDSRNVHSAT